MVKKVLYNTGSQIIGKGFTATTSLIVTILIGRSLGPAGYGEFTKIFVYVGYFYTFVDFGLNSIYVKVANVKSQIGLLRSLAGLRLLLALLFAITAISISLLLPYDEVLKTGFSPLVKTGIIIGSLTIFTQALFTTANAYFQKNLRYDLSTIAAIFGALIILVTASAVTLINASILGYVYAYVFGGVVLAVCAYLLIYKKTRKIILPRLDCSFSSRLLFTSWPIGLALILNLIYFRVDILILANTRSTTEVGLYGLAYQFFESSLAIPIFFVNAIYPILTAIYKENIRNFYKQVRFWFLFLVLTSLGLMVFLYLVSFLIPVIYDSRFLESQIPLRILALGMPAFFISALLWHLLIIQNKQKFLVLVYATGAIFNLITNLIFIPKYGMIAAAIITVVSEGLILILLVIFVLKVTSSLRLAGREV